MHMPYGSALVTKLGKHSKTCLQAGYVFGKDFFLMIGCLNTVVLSYIMVE